MPIQQRGETKFLFLLLSWPEQTPHKVGKSASRLGQAKILICPLLPPVTSKIPEKLTSTVPALFFFFF